MKPLLAACMLILFAFSSGADDGQTIVTTKGVRYEKAVVTGITPATATLTHAEGVVTVPMWELPPELQKKYGYDPVKAKAWIKVATAAYKNYADALRSVNEANARAEQDAAAQQQQRNDEAIMSLMRVAEGGGRIVYDPATRQIYGSQEEAEISRGMALKAALRARFISTGK